MALAALISSYSETALVLLLSSPIGFVAGFVMIFSNPILLIIFSVFIAVLFLLATAARHILLPSAKSHEEHIFLGKAWLILAFLVFLFSVYVATSSCSDATCLQIGMPFLSIAAFSIVVGIYYIIVDKVRILAVETPAKRRQVKVKTKASGKGSKISLFHEKFSIVLAKVDHNPIISPRAENAWESWQTFNPAAILGDNKVHFLYRAIGSSGRSVLGYACSKDGLTLNERHDKPVYMLNETLPEMECGVSYLALKYSSGGGWGGCEDPRLTEIDGKYFLTFVAFDSWNLPRIALTSIEKEDFLNKKWNWKQAKLISPPDVVTKSAVIFPEKIRGKYVIMHRIFPNILIDYVDSLDFKDGQYLEEKKSIKIRKSKWDSRKIGAGAPPIKTKDGWLLIYYAVDDKDDSQYKIGAMLLDLERPEKVLYRTDQPILSPVEWYENEGHKSGVSYPCGAVVKEGTLYVYYGGADTVVAVASAPIKTFINTLKQTKKPKLRSVGKKR